MRLFGLGTLGDQSSELESKINVLQKKLLEISQRGSIGIPEVGVDLNARQVEMNQIQTQINILTDELNAITTKDSVKAAEIAASPLGVANANKKAADDFKAQMFFLRQPGYDYGRGSSARNNFFKGLGAIMIPKTSPSLYNLHNQDGLGDLFADILAGGRVAVSNFKASGSKLPSMPNIPGGIKIAGVSAPSWVTNLGKAVMSGAKVVKQRQAKPAVNMGTGGAEVYEVQAPAPNYLAWGAAALAVGVAAIVVRGRR